MPFRGQPEKVETIGAESVMRYTTTFESRRPAANLADALKPLPRAAEIAKVRTNQHPVCIEAYEEPVVHVESDSTHVSRVPIRLVPAYTVAVEPKQTIEELASQHKPFDVFLRVHSYSQHTAKVSVGLDVPEGWKSSEPVDLSFAGESDRYAKIRLTPPAKLDATKYTITAYAKRVEEESTFSIEPQSFVRALTREESVQMVVQAFDIVDADRTKINRAPVKIVPAHALAAEPKLGDEKLAVRHEPFDVVLRVHSYSTKPTTAWVGLDVPEGWKSSGEVELDFAGEGDRYAKITVTPAEKLTTENLTITAYAQLREEFTTSIEPLVSMPTLTWEEPAQTVVHAFDIKVPENLRVGYISAESEPVPDALKMLGIHVEMLDASALNFGDLSKYDAIVVGVRAYELRGELPGANQRLLDYAQNGGTLVVQYQRDFAWDKKDYGPYPATIANKPGDPLPRITDENSPVKFLKPDDPLLNAPNKITQDDFKGWVQERGLYFWSEYDSRYTPLLAMNDPGENDLDGALVYTKLGKGTYIYTGIAFFRQLPEGVPGAYRLFVNLLAASRSR